MNKNICFLLILILLGTTHSFAQQSTQQLDDFKKAEQARKMKIAGATLTVLGGVLMIAGGLTFRNDVSGEGSPETGAVLFVLGIGGIASGIPIMALGAKNQKKYLEKSDGLSVRINANPRSTGLTLSYRF